MGHKLWNEIDVLILPEKLNQKLFSEVSTVVCEKIIVSIKKL